MRIQGLVLTSALALGSLAASAQDLAEAYNLSNRTVQGTARSMGFGSALGSVGGDFSSISVNPAGLGIYRTSEWTITPSLKINSAAGNYMGTTTYDNNTHFNMNNVGIVFTKAAKGQRYERSNWKAVSFAIGMNRVADFNNSYTYSGNNYASSATQAMASDANLNPGGVSTPGTLGYLGNTAGLINSNGVNGSYISSVPISNGTQQTKIVQDHGGIDEFEIALGGNYKEKLMLGASIGIPTFYYTRDMNYTETALNGSAPNTYNFNYFTYGNSLQIAGTGINAKIGAIYKITDFLRVGASFHTPTYYNLTDLSDPSIIAQSNGLSTSLSAPSGLPENQFNYGFTTPWKTVLSATFIIRKLGFITADYEYVDYNTMRYIYPAGNDDANGMTYQQEEAQMNQQIKSTYQAASNVRVGAEIKLTRYLMIRGGFGYYGDPYKNAGYSATRTDVSAGLGFHTHHFFTDFAVVNSQYKAQENPYTIAGTSSFIPVATTNYSLNNVALTIGMKF